MCGWDWLWVGGRIRSRERQPPEISSLVGGHWRTRKFDEARMQRDGCTDSVMTSWCTGLHTDSSATSISTWNKHWAQAISSCTWLKEWVQACGSRLYMLTHWRTRKHDEARMQRDGCIDSVMTSWCTGLHTDSSTTSISTWNKHLAQAISSCTWLKEWVQACGSSWLYMLTQRVGSPCDQGGSPSARER
jgi:hypothetical protein